MKYSVLSLLASTVFLVASTENNMTVHKEYYPEGNIKKEITYKNSKKDGWETEYDKSGLVIHESKWENGKQVGRSFEYTWFENRLLSILEYSIRPLKNLTGISYSFYKSGSLKYETHYKDGEKVVSKDFFRNGRLKNIGHFKNGEPYGEARVYYPNGQLRFRSRPVDGFWRVVEEYKFNGVRVK